MLSHFFFSSDTEKFEAHFKDERRKKKQKLAHEPNQSDDAAQRDQIKSLVEDGNLDAILAVLKQVKQDKQVKELHGFESSLTIMLVSHSLFCYIASGFSRCLLSPGLPCELISKSLSKVSTIFFKHACENS